MTLGSRVDRWFVVSDLHLGGRPGPRNLDSALPRFLDTVVRRPPAGTATTGRRALVLLGDTFDLSGPAPVAPAGVAERLATVARCHPRVVTALAACVRDGVELHVVGGNHDLEMVRPDASASLVRLLGLEPDRPGVRFWPWMIHEPGVLYAEHGSQHHPLNRSPTVLRAREPGWVDGPLPPPPLAAASPGTEWCRPDGPVAVRVARAVRAARRQEESATTPAYLRLLEREAVAVRLPVRAVTELAAVSRFRAAPAVAGAAARTGARRLGRERVGEYLLAPATEVHRILERHGVAVPAYVFGHTHRAEQRVLDGARTPARYLNAGTWCAAVRGAGPDRADPALFPFVEVAATDEEVRGRLGYWCAADGAVRADGADRVVPLVRDRMSGDHAPSERPGVRWAEKIGSRRRDEHGG